MQRRMEAVHHGSSVQMSLRGLRTEEEHTALKALRVVSIVWDFLRRAKCQRTYIR